MPADTRKLDLVPGPRASLMEHLDAITEKRTEYQEIVAQHRRLQAFLKAEAEAQAKVDAIRQRDAKELAELLINSSGTRVTVNHGEQSKAERELARAKREADVARACELAVIERMAESSRQIDALEQRVPLMKSEILIGEGAALAAEINAEAKRLRRKYARLWGLRRYVGDTAAIRRRLDAVPLPTHPDHVSPDGAELLHAAETWRAYAARLAADPDAEFKE